MNTRILQRILYVEDDPDIQAAARLALECIGGFTIEVCSSGQEAQAKGAAFAPDLILLDVMMPDMDGPATLKVLRNMTVLSATPVIFVTASVQANEVVEYKTMGALGTISKPFDPMTLSDQIKAIWSNQN